MIATDIFAALWKKKSIIVLFVAVALLLCHLGLFMGQTYTVAVYIKYLEDKAEDGLATNGTELDPYEITSPFVVTKALEQLGMENKNVNSIAQRIKVTPMISAAEQEKYASWIDEFSDYENTEDGKASPVYYRIEFKSKEGIQFGQAFLSALIQQYRNYYTERYSGLNEVTLVPESVVMNADYFTAVEMLRKQIKDVKTTLGNISSGDMDYRSPLTGYSLDDLRDAYDLLLKTKLAPVTQYILDTGVSKDLATLVASLQQSSATAQRESDENIVKASTQKQMMQLYAEKNQEYMSFVMGQDDREDQIYGDVERDRAYLRVMTTYDELMLEYVDYAVKSGDLLIDKAYINANLSKFRDVAFNAVAPIDEISDIYEQYASLMSITEETLDGYNAFKSGRVILKACGIQTTEDMPELFYYTVSGILALCFGCGLLVFLELKKTRVNHDEGQEDLSDGVL